MEIEKLNRIFADSECISNDLMMAYIDGKLSGKQKHVIEAHIGSCELCRDEFEGLQLMRDKNKLPEIVHELNLQITKKVHRNRKISLFPQVISMAAIILLLVGFAWFFFYIIHISPSSLKNNELAQALEEQEALKELEMAEETNRIRDSLDVEVVPQLTRQKKEREIIANQYAGTNEKKEELVVEDEVIEEKHKIDEVPVNEFALVENLDDIADREIKADLTDEKKALVSSSEIAKGETSRKESNKSKRSKEVPASDNQNGIDAFEKKDYPKAIAIFKSAEKAGTIDVEQIYYLGRSYQQLNDLNNAIIQYNKLIDLPSNNWTEKAYWNKAQVQIKLGQNHAAIKTLEQLISLKGNLIQPAQNQVDSLLNK